MGNFVGKEATGAVGASSLLFTCIIGLFTGVSIGVGVAVAQKIGSKDYDMASKVSHTAITFGIFGGIIFNYLRIFLCWISFNNNENSKGNNEWFCDLLKSIFF